MLRTADKNDIRIKRTDESKHLIEGVKDERKASVYVKDVGKGVSQLIVTVDTDEKESSDELALEIVNNICSEIGETCKLSK